MVEALLAQPRWREVYASSQDILSGAQAVGSCHARAREELQEKAADPALHADIKKVLFGKCRAATSVKEAIC